uniref:Uncharacterized protein n=1 Tax=Oryza sativa subsp. japonica TaxID=39947 RepID=Q6Z3B3_ORYSJ|nr:hypothetical protein [Oryza sativa Japonica Group]
MALKESKAMEEILDEMEEKHDDAFARITLLETQKPPSTAHGGESLPASTRPSNTRKRKDREDEAEEVAAAAAAQEEEGAMRRGKAVARRRSLVSLGMAAVVGAVAWAADAPCLPLLVGLFATMGVSMCSVTRFFFLRESAAALRGGRPTFSSSNTVPLLSLNWFLLGILTSPMLPGAAHAIVSAANLSSHRRRRFSSHRPPSGGGRSKGRKGERKRNDLRLGFRFGFIFISDT